MSGLVNIIMHVTNSDFFNFFLFCLQFYINNSKWDLKHNIFIIIKIYNIHWLQIARTSCIMFVIQAINYITDFRSQSYICLVKLGSGPTFHLYRYYDIMSIASRVLTSTIDKSISAYLQLLNQSLNRSGTFPNIFYNNIITHNRIKLN